MQEVTARSFMPLSECPSRRCAVNKARGQLNLQARGSKFAKFQEVLAPKYLYQGETTYLLGGASRMKY